MAINTPSGHPSSLPIYRHRRSGSTSRNGSNDTQSDSSLALAINSILLERNLLASRAGQQFSTNRDLYDALGYKDSPEYADYYARYRRQDVAQVIVNRPAEDTWRSPPEILDGTKERSSPNSPFTRAARELISSTRAWHYLMRADKLAGIGHYGALLLGFSGSDDLSTPLRPNNQDLIYLRPLDEESAQINEIDQDSSTPNFGKPLTYLVQLGPDLDNYSSAIKPLNLPTTTLTVHHTRVIHIAEGLLQDDVYGTPRLEPVYNRLDDLEKIVGGSSEIAWRTMDRGMAFKVADGYDPSTLDTESLRDEIDEYFHGLRRYLRLAGIDVQELGAGIVPDPSHLFDVVISSICASTGMPQRILLGTESGELASSQDVANWAGRIAARQRQFAEPVILRPFIDKLVNIGTIPPPEQGEYTVTWRPLFALNEKEQAEVANTYATAMQRLATPGVDMIIDQRAFVQRMTPFTQDDTPDLESMLREEDQEIIPDRMSIPEPSMEDSLSEEFDTDVVRS